VVKLSLERKSYPPAENLTRMIEGLSKLSSFPYPSYFRYITGNPANWPKNIKTIYNTNRSFFNSIKKILPSLNSDEITFLMNELKLIEENNYEISDYLSMIKHQVGDDELYQQYMHFLYRVTNLNQPIRCIILNDEGKELIKYYDEDEISNFLHQLFLNFLTMRTFLFSQVLQHPYTLNIGNIFKNDKAKDVEQLFDLIIKPQFKGRDAASTESKNIRRWLEYFGLLNKGDIYYFDYKRFKLLIVGSLTKFLNIRFSENHTLLWEKIKNDVVTEVHLDPEIIDIEELFDLIIKANTSKISWIPSERGEEEFKGHKDKQVLQIQTSLNTPKAQRIEESDFITIPSTPKIENADLIRSNKLEDFWRV